MSRTTAPDRPRRALAKLLQANAHRNHLWDVFSDFVEMSALAVRQHDPRGWDEREQRYLSIAGKYDRDEQQRFAQAFATLVEAMEEEPGDVLGAIFGELELGNAARGQFFTPYEICRLMANVTIGDGADVRARIAERGFITASEPACGAGAQIIALAEVLRDAGINYQQHLHVTAVDVDARAVHMTYLQLSLLHVPAVVIVGNTLTLEEREHWPTPAHILGMWDQKLRRGYAFGSAMDRDRPLAGIAAAPGEDLQYPPIPAAAPIGSQLDLFGVAA